MLCLSECAISCSPEHDATPVHVAVTPCRVQVASKVSLGCPLMKYPESHLKVMLAPSGYDVFRGVPPSELFTIGADAHSAGTAGQGIQLNNCNSRMLHPILFVC